MTYSTTELEVLRKGGGLLANILQEVASTVAPGVTTEQLNELAEKRIRACGGAPSFLGYRGAGGVTPFTSTLCISVNDEVVHGPAVPNRILQDGDIVGLDIGMRYPAQGGLCTDTAVTVPVGTINEQDKQLIAVTKEALRRGISAVKPNSQVREISQVIQTYVEAAGFSIVRELVGHGVGHNVHEEPEIPNFVFPGPIGDYQLPMGSVVAIEPMVNVGDRAVITKEDGWTVATKDGLRSAHFEHTIAVTSEGVEIITLRPEEKS